MGEPLELDHVFCVVEPDGDWAARLEQAGWALDAGNVHAGQGTRNRRLIWAGSYLELLWVADAAEARANPLRLDRRAEWRTTGASPFGFGLRGRLSEDDLGDYWRYDALGLPIWIHRDNDEAPEKPLVFVLEMDDETLERRRSHVRPAPGGRGVLVSADLRGPAPVSLPRHAGPPIAYRPGEHHLTLHVADGAALAVNDVLALDGQ